MTRERPPRCADLESVPHVASGVRIFRNTGPIGIDRAGKARRSVPRRSRTALPSEQHLITAEPQFALAA